MTRRLNALLYGVVCCYFLVRCFRAFRYPALNSSWFAPYVNVLAVGMAFYAAFEFYRNRDNTQRTGERGVSAEPVSRIERIFFKLLGVPTIFAGLVLIGLGCWTAWDQWTSAQSVVISRTALSSASWDLLKGSALEFIFGGLLLAGGVFVYRNPSARRA
jgi:hypothetical protein